MLRSPFYSQSISLCICEVTALLCAFSVLIPWKMHSIILSFPLIHTQTQHTHTHTLIRWQKRHAHKRLVGIRDRAETKELIFTRKIFSLNRDLRRLRVPVSFFLVVSLTIAPFLLLLLLLLHRCYRSKKNCVLYMESRWNSLYTVWLAIIRVVGSFFLYSLLLHLFVVWI